MTVSTTNSRISYNGNGASLSFNVTFPFLEAADLLVFVNGELKTLTTDYTVTGGNGSTGTVVFLTAPVSGSANVVIVRDVDLLQETDYQANDPFPAQSHERALDKLTMIAQRLRDQANRSLRYSDSYTGAASPSLPDPQSDQLFGWDSTGNALQNYPLASLATAIAFASYKYDTFEADGIQTEFELSVDPVTLANLDVSISGATQVPAVDYSLIDGVLVFEVPPPDGTVVLAHYGQAVASAPGAFNIPYTAKLSGAVEKTAGDKLGQYISASDVGKAGGDTIANLVGITPQTDGVYYSAVSYYNNWIAVSSLPQGGGMFVWSASTPKSAHNGGTIISPTVPWNGTTSTLTNFLNKVGETQPSGFGCWLRVLDDTTSVEAEMFGALGTSITINATPSFKAASTFLGAQGGGVINARGKYLIDTNLILDANVVIKGENKNFKQGKSDQGPLAENFSLNSLNSQFVVNPAVSVQMGNAGGVEGIVFVRKGLVTPFLTLADAKTQLAEFAGTALRNRTGVFNGGRDTYIGHCSFWGFDYAVEIIGSPRFDMEHCTFDCNNGGYFENVADFSNIVRCVGGLYLTQGGNFATGLIGSRPGIGFVSRNAYTQYDRCFVGGWEIGFLNDSSQVVSYDMCSFDYGAGNLYVRHSSFKFEDKVYTTAGSTLSEFGVVPGATIYMNISSSGTGTLANPPGFYEIVDFFGQSEEFYRTEAVVPRTPVLLDATYRKLGGRVLEITYPAHGVKSNDYIYLLFSGGASRFIRVQANTSTADTFRVFFPTVDLSFYNALPGNSSTDTPLEFEKQILNQTQTYAPEYVGEVSALGNTLNIELTNNPLQLDDLFFAIFFDDGAEYKVLSRVTSIVDANNFVAVSSDLSLPTTVTGLVYVQRKTGKGFVVQGSSNFCSISSPRLTGAFTSVEVNVATDQRECVSVTGGSFSESRIVVKNGSLLFTGNKMRGSAEFDAIIVENTDNKDRVTVVGNDFDTFRNVFECDPSRFNLMQVGKNNLTRCSYGIPQIDSLYSDTYDEQVYSYGPENSVPTDLVRRTHKVARGNDEGREFPIALDRLKRDAVEIWDGEAYQKVYEERVTLNSITTSSGDLVTAPTSKMWALSLSGEREATDVLELTQDGHLYPQLEDSQQLGSSARPWNSIYSSVGLFTRNEAGREVRIYVDAGNNVQVEAQLTAVLTMDFANMTFEKI